MKRGGLDPDQIDPWYFNASAFQINYRKFWQTAVRAGKRKNRQQNKMSSGNTRGEEEGQCFTDIWSIDFTKRELEKTHEKSFHHLSIIFREEEREQLNPADDTLRSDARLSTSQSTASIGRRSWHRWWRQDAGISHTAPSCICIIAMWKQTYMDEMYTKQSLTVTLRCGKAHRVRKLQDRRWAWRRRSHLINVTHYLI